MNQIKMRSFTIMYKNVFKSNKVKLFIKEQLIDLMASGVKPMRTQKINGKVLYL